MKYGKLYLRIRESTYFLKFSLIIDKVIREKEENWEFENVEKKRKKNITSMW